MTENTDNISVEYFITPPRSRQVNLMAWLAERGLSMSKLGAKIGVTAQGAHAMIMGETVHPYRHAQLLALGIPWDLLPVAELIKSGPKRNQKREERGDENEAKESLSRG